MRMIPAWTVDARRLKDENAEVRASCSKCKVWTLVDLDKVIAARGDRFSFWNRRPPCPKGCGGDLVFLAMRPGAAVWATRMFDLPPAYVAEIHARWIATWPAEKRDKLPLLPLIHAVRGCVHVGCDRCESLEGYQLSVDDVRAWANHLRQPRLSTEDLAAVLRGMCAGPACGIVIDLIEGPWRISD